MIAGIVLMLATGCTLSNDLPDIQAGVPAEAAPGDAATRVPSTYDGHYYPDNSSWPDNYPVPTKIILNYDDLSGKRWL